MALVMLDCGVRPGELVKITPDDVDTDLMEINLPAEITKTRRSRIVPISMANLHNHTLYFCGTQLQSIDVGSIMYESDK